MPHNQFKKFDREYSTPLNKPHQNITCCKNLMHLCNSQKPRCFVFLNNKLINNTRQQTPTLMKYLMTTLEILEAFHHFPIINTYLLQ